MQSPSESKKEHTEALTFCIINKLAISINIINIFIFIFCFHPCSLYGNKLVTILIYKPFGIQLVTNLYHLGNKGYYLNFLNNSMVNKWYILGTVQASEYRTKVLISLREKPKTPAILEKEIKIKMS